LSANSLSSSSRVHLLAVDARTHTHAGLIGPSQASLSQAARQAKQGDVRASRASCVLCVRPWLRSAVSRECACDRGTLAARVHARDGPISPTPSIFSSIMSVRPRRSVLSPTTTTKPTAHPCSNEAKRSTSKLSTVALSLHQTNTTTNRTSKCSSPTATSSNPTDCFQTSHTHTHPVSQQATAFQSPSSPATKVSREVSHAARLIKTIHLKD
jgi:hypothetical protein